MDTTSISALPTNTPQQGSHAVQGSLAPQGSQAMQPTMNDNGQSYNPNVSAPPPGPQPTLTNDMIKEVSSSIQQVGQDGSTALPSRDIPRDTLHHVADVQVNADHIPIVDKMRDYIGEYDDTQEVIQKHLQEAQEKDRLDHIYHEIQHPLLIMMMYFLFQLPIVNSSLHKILPKLFHKDGNPTIGGLMMKTFAFGALFYGIVKSISFI